MIDIQHLCADQWVFWLGCLTASFITERLVRPPFPIRFARFAFDLCRQRVEPMHTQIFYFIGYGVGKKWGKHSIDSGMRWTATSFNHCQQRRALRLCSATLKPTSVLPRTQSWAGATIQYANRWWLCKFAYHLFFFLIQKIYFIVVSWIEWTF